MVTVTPGDGTPRPSMSSDTSYDAAELTGTDTPLSSAASKVSLAAHSAGSDGFEHVEADAAPAAADASLLGSTGVEPSGAQTPAAAAAATAAAAAAVAAIAAAPKARLLFARSHVSIHPTAFSKDNVAGILGVVVLDDTARPLPDTHGAGRGGTVVRPEALVCWVPEETVRRLGDDEREGYRKVEEGTEEDGFVFVSVPPPKGESYAFSVPVTSLYSILVYPPSLSHWYGTATFNLIGGISLPTLFFHDDESAVGARSAPRSEWGFPPFLTVLEQHSSMLRSRLVAPNANRGGELWLVNPSKADREVHEGGVVEPARPAVKKTATPSTPSKASTPSTPTTPSSAPYPPKPTYPQLTMLGQTTPRDSLLVGLSNITNFSRRAAQNVLSHPLAKPVVPHLPPAVRSLINAPGEWERARLPDKVGKAPDVASEFESARLYLARWARVVAEEGERARRDEVAARAGTGKRASLDGGGGGGGGDVDALGSSLGVFSFLPRPNARRAGPKPTRTPQHPITARDWDGFVLQGRDELSVRREIFKRGLADGAEPADRRARREAWEVLLGVVPWAYGGVGGGEQGRTRRWQARDEVRRAKRAEYDALKAKWMAEAEGKGDVWKEEWHRIDVDCRRTDRSQPLFAVSTANAGNEEKEAGGAAASWAGVDKEEEGGMAGLNRHVAALRTILMTYHMYAPELGYVQGMSDLLSPIYVVFEANEADAFWGLVGVMGMMEQNFLRDQSGMRKQLSTLQQLIGLMDPELYGHLERTDSLNLFFCFRWILIAFKREFKFEQVIKLWEVLWTNYYSTQFVLFVALAVLQSHRDVLLRYLTEFDEVLKYANDLSGTIDLDTTLAQAEVLFLSFREIVDELDAAAAQANDDAAAGLRHRRRASAGAAGPASASRPGPGSGPDTAGTRRINGVDVPVPVRDGAPPPPAPTVGPDLRELLVCWREKGKGKEV